MSGGWERSAANDAEVRQALMQRSLARVRAAASRMPAAERMTVLAETFPALRRAPGVRPWDAEELAAWTDVCSSGELHAVRFVLWVWNVFHDWPCGPFEIVKAVNVWDDENRAAFLAWAEAPWTA